MTGRVLVVNPRKKAKKKVVSRRKKRTTKSTSTTKKRSTAARRRAALRRVSARRKTTASRRLAAQTTGVKTMARRKKRSTTKRRRNPSPKTRKVARRAAKSIGASFQGMNFRAAFKNVLPTQFGMFAAKWAAKRLSEGGAQDTDPESWNYGSYLKGSLGSVLAGMIANMIKPGTGQKVLEGGLNLMIYKAIRMELIQNSEWALNQFGAEEEEYVPTEYLMTGLGQNEWFLGQEPNIELPEIEMGSALEPVGPLGGNSLEPVGPLGLTDPFMRAYN